MSKLKRPIIVIVVFLAICILIGAVGCFIYYRAWSKPYEPITISNVTDYCGDDLWKNVLNKYDYVEVKNIPMKKTMEKHKDFSLYSPNIYIAFSDKEDFITKTNTIQAYIASYLSNNPNCDINKFDNVCFTYVKLRNSIEVEYSNTYCDEKLDSFSHITIRSEDNDFFSISDIKKFCNDNSYLDISIHINKKTDLSALKEINVSLIHLYVNDDLINDLQKEITSMDLPYEIIIN